MNEHLVEIEKKALALKNSGKMPEASILLEKIIKEMPSWEHGYGYYNLAECYEDMREFDKAREAYENAIKLDRNNSMFVGAYASFLYLQGQTVETFEWYLKLLSLENSQGDQKLANDTKKMLSQLAEKLNYTELELDNYLQQAMYVTQPTAISVPILNKFQK
jgi:tetratricopeptide (TPR) repeat protein